MMGPINSCPCGLFYSLTAPGVLLASFVFLLSGCSESGGDGANVPPTTEITIPVELLAEPTPERVEELIEIGRTAFTQKGCIACHMVNGAALTGPALANIYGLPITLADGQVIQRDLPYLYRSIVAPSEYKSSQDSKMIMPPYAYLDEETLVGMSYFVRSLTDATSSSQQQPEGEGLDE